MEKFRIDNAYEKVYSYDADENAYYFYGSFYAIGINRNMSRSQQLDIITTDEMSHGLINPEY